MGFLNEEEAKKQVFSEGYFSIARNRIVYTLLECKTFVTGDGFWSRTIKPSQQNALMCDT
jgi:hypothetical protein